MFSIQRSNPSLALQMDFLPSEPPGKPSKNLPYSIGNFIQYSVMNVGNMGKESKKEWEKSVCIYTYTHTYN